MPLTVIVDLNGTLADCRHRDHLVKQCKPKRWDAYYAAMVDDQPVLPVIALLKSLTARIIIWSGHPEPQRSKAEAWLNKYGVPFDQLLMRKDKDFRKDTEIKVEWLIQISSPVDQLLVIEDRMSVANTMRAHGIACLHCTDNWE